ncbi:MAG: nuclear transport factor 2 family protein [Gemmatimonadaceae bacterium]|nr:nuclear transport factor 2 family protein [Gemmatimonadaceae bacterium]
MSTAQMTTMEIANILIELCRQGQNHEAMKQLYSDEIVSIEASAPPGQSRESRGLEGAMAKGQWWADNHIVHSASIGGPWPHGDRFIVTYHYDVTFKPENKRFVMEEAALYTIRDGKIVHEEFFYAM